MEQVVFYASISSPRPVGWWGGVFVKAKKEEDVPPMLEALNLVPPGFPIQAQISIYCGDPVPERDMNRLLTLADIDRVSGGHDASTHCLCGKPVHKEKHETH